MARVGADVTWPTLDLDDFIGLSIASGPDGKVYQLPDQQFAHLHWFHHDWCTDPDLMAQFESIDDYPPGASANASAASAG